jgi:hypothetical protein
MSYSGSVTLVTKRGGKTIKKKTNNNGTQALFELYARALSGQRVDGLLPAYIDIGIVDGSFTSHLKEHTPVIVTYTKDEGDSPITRVEAVVTKQMMNTATSNADTVKLISRSGGVELAHTTVDGIGDAITKLSAGTHMIVVWDLKVENKDYGGEN